VLVKVIQQTVEDLTLLVEEQVLERGLLLLVQHLLHDFGEVTAQNGKGLFLLIKEAA